MKLKILFVFVCAVFNALAQSSTYTNPVLEKTVPDPTVVADEDGNFYMYGTNMAKKVPIYTSRNLVDWSYCADSFTEDQMPTGLEGGGIWAPDVIRHNGKYLMAYSYSKGGEYHDNGIGLAIADKPQGPFTNLGLLFTSDSSGVRNSIDPSLVDDKGKLYLLWGSFNGLYIVELKWDKDGKYYIPDINSKREIAGKAFEGSHIFKRGKYYYLFASVGRCCSEDKSTYRVGVGRSKNLFGPYVDSDGVPMLDNGYNLVVSSNEKFVGPGHGSRIITDKDGKTWYIYHSYIRGKGGKGRMPMLDEIKWSAEGWPYIYHGTPSTKPTNSPNL
ncbi:MAG: family 43 glycosylhydrolase [Muribaculaceae bacterium]|nr:family 43 glycosylhydrolase [Muribaculaceae bacterium]